MNSCMPWSSIEASPPDRFATSSYVTVCGYWVVLHWLPSLHTAGECGQRPLRDYCRSDWQDLPDLFVSKARQRNGTKTKNTSVTWQCENALCFFSSTFRIVQVSQLYRRTETTTTYSKTYLYAKAEFLLQLDSLSVHLIQYVYASVYFLPDESLLLQRYVNVKPFTVTDDNFSTEPDPHSPRSLRSLWSDTLWHTANSVPAATFKQCANVLHHWLLSADILLMIIRERMIDVIMAQAFANNNRLNLGQDLHICISGSDP